MGYDYEYADPMNIIEYSLKVYTPPPKKKTVAYDNTSQQCCKDLRSISCNITVGLLQQYMYTYYIGLLTTTTYKLQLSHNAAARIINRTLRHEHTTPILQELH